jgi:arsenate reductase (glutaredoxin)
VADLPIAVTIYHNPACGTSRNVLALIRNAGIEPHVIEYLKTPPDRATLESLLERMHMKPRALLREKGTPYAELGLGDETNRPEGGAVFRFTVPLAYRNDRERDLHSIVNPE